MTLINCPSDIVAYVNGVPRSIQDVQSEFWFDEHEYGLPDVISQRDALQQGLFRSMSRDERGKLSAEGKRLTVPECVLQWARTFCAACPYYQNDARPASLVADANNKGRVIEPTDRPTRYAPTTKPLHWQLCADQAALRTQKWITVNLDLLEVMRQREIRMKGTSLIPTASGGTTAKEATGPNQNRRSVPRSNEDDDVICTAVTQARPSTLPGPNTSVASGRQHQRLTTAQEQVAARGPATSSRPASSKPAFHASAGGHGLR
jgi:hypothetical protein